MQRPETRQPHNIVAVCLLRQGGVSIHGDHSQSVWKVQMNECADLSEGQTEDVIKRLKQKHVETGTLHFHFFLVAVIALLSNRQLALQSCYVLIKQGLRSAVEAV